MERRSDEDLLAAHLAGRRGAFDALVDRYTNELFGFLCRFVGSATLADDLVQETFLQVHLAAGTFDRQRAFKPWMYTIAANKARDALRSKTRRPELSLDAHVGDDDKASPGLTLEAHESPPAELTDSAETQEAVRGMVNRMPEHLRAILILGYYQQLPYADIAEILDIPVGTVKSRLHAAVNHFARLWRARHPAQADSAGV
ncbi:MAG: sigma-70 family RNA polymerase sigma factor [Phycisphaerae bacterium]